MADRAGIPYSPDAGMGKMVVQLLARIARQRRRFTTAEYDSVVNRQGGCCACGCGVGRVRVGDSTWKVRGPDTAAGERVRVIDVDSTTLKVEKA